MRKALVISVLFAVACSSSGTWRRVETPHFELRTDLGSSDAKRAAVALEETRDALISAEWPGVAFKDVKAQVYVLANGLDFERYFGKNVDGICFHTSPPMFILYGPASRWELRRSAQFPTVSVLRHEMAHQLSGELWPNQPRWFAEGLANFLEPVYYGEEDNTVILGGVNWRAYREYRGVRSVTIEDAISWSGNNETMSSRMIGGYYGLSWLLVHWLYYTHQDALQRFVDALQDGKDPREAFRLALPNLDLAAANKELYQYYQHGKFEERSTPLVSSKIVESALQDQVLDPGEVSGVKATLAEAARTYTGPTHGAEEPPSSSTGPGLVKRPAPSRVDYSALPPLPQYPCSDGQKDSGLGAAERTTTTTGAAETRPAATPAGTRPRKKATDGSKTPATGGHLPPEVIQRIVRAGYDGMRKCYEEGLRTNPELGGKVTVRFVIQPDGLVHDLTPGCTSLADPAAVSCIVRQFARLKFPSPESGSVTVVYPIMFSPED